MSSKQNRTVAGLFGLLALAACGCGDTRGSEPDGGHDGLSACRELCSSCRIGDCSTCTTQAQLAESVGCGAQFTAHLECWAPSMCADDGTCDHLGSAAVTCACPGLLTMLSDAASSCGYTLDRSCDTENDRSHVISCMTSYSMRGCAIFEPGSGSCALAM